MRVVSSLRAPRRRRWIGRFIDGPSFRVLPDIGAEEGKIPAAMAQSSGRRRHPQMRAALAGSMGRAPERIDAVGRALCLRARPFGGPPVACVENLASLGAAVKGPR
jgi:hypothetical protein